MLKDDPKSLHLEVRAAESRRDEALKDFDERLGKYTGPWYKGSDGDGLESEEEPEPISVICYRLDITGAIGEAAASQ